MGYLGRADVEALGFRHVGRDVMISDRASIYGAEEMEIGDFSRIDDFCCVSGRVTMGRNVHIALGCNVAGGEPGITFEDFSGLAYGCHVFAQSDDYSGTTMTNATVPDCYKKETKKAVRIGRHCIIGTSSLVFPGVEVAEGTAVGALSVVTQSTQAWSIYTGNPAKRVWRRQQTLLKLERAYLANS